MFALGAAGSILGTLTAGYLFISWIGSSGTMLAVAGLYLAFAVAYWMQGRKSFVPAPVLALFVLAGLGLGQLPGYAAPCRVESDYSSSEERRVWTRCFWTVRTRLDHD